MAAAFVFVYIGLVLPGTIYRVINRYQPKPHPFNESGDELDLEIDYKEFLTMYRLLLARDTCPYRFLCGWYKYGRSAYHVIALVVKMLLVLPVTPLLSSSMALSRTRSARRSCGRSSSTATTGSTSARA